ncbi:MAG: PAS domain S-box protein [Oscillochloris sp.]|nr:PAS domain S-box protein [Oscillochloris sp.]
MSEVTNSEDMLASLRARVTDLERELAAAKAEIEHLKLFEKLIESAPDNVVVVNMENKVIYVNQATVTQNGWESAQAMIDFGDITSFVSPEEQQRLNEIVAPQLFQHGRSSWNSTFYRADRSRFAGVCSSFVIADESGVPIAIASFIRDMSEQVRIEQRMIDSERYLSALLESIPIVLFALDNEGRFTRSEGKGLQTLGLQPGQVVGASFFEIYASYPEFIDAARKAIGGDQVNLRIDDGTLGFDHWLAPLTTIDGKPNGMLGVSIDISEQLQAEAAQLRFQEEMIAGQRQALRELSTPLVPIADGVLAMPLVGTIDDNRAQQIMETLLEGIAERQADVAILDITGVRVVDTQVADALLRVARASRLLGTRIILTGIGAEVAQTLVGLGADMSGLHTAATLKEGIAAALGDQTLS